MGTDLLDHPLQPDLPVTNRSATGRETSAARPHYHARAAAELDAGGASDKARRAVFSLEESLKKRRVIDTIYKAGRSGRWENVPV